MTIFNQDLYTFKAGLSSLRDGRAKCKEKIFDMFWQLFTAVIHNS